ncbi:MAG: 30S ribosomal protein S2 [Phycisphaerae bacterium]
MASELVRELIDAGIHFGHRASRWNPKMSPYLFGKRNSIHIIDIRQTVKGLLRAKKFLSAIVAQGQDVLIVGTKRQAKDIVVKQTERVGMHHVSERWLGGTLTNFKTIRSRLTRLEYLEELERSGKINEYSKKAKSQAARERKKISRNLEGIRKMTRLPGALVIIDVRREHIAVKEARKLGIPTVCLVDTDSDPDGADIIIPGNDDAMRAVDLIMTQLTGSIEEGKRGRAAVAATQEKTPGGPGHARRSKRMTTSALAAQQADSESSEPSQDKPVEALTGASAPDEVASSTGDKSVSPAPEVSDGVS